MKVVDGGIYIKYSSGRRQLSIYNQKYGGMEADGGKREGAKGADVGNGAERISVLDLGGQVTNRIQAEVINGLNE